MRIDVRGVSHVTKIWFTIGTLFLSVSGSSSQTFSVSWLRYLAASEALKSAFTAFRDEVWAVGLRTYMTERSTSHPSMGIWVDQQHRRYYRVDSRDITSCDIIMAAKLMKPEAYNVDYKLHTYGEDMGWSLGVTEAGGNCATMVVSQIKHVMVREQLNF